jgi:hypothetical protein
LDISTHRPLSKDMGRFMVKLPLFKCAADGFDFRKLVKILVFDKVVYLFIVDALFAGFHKRVYLLRGMSLALAGVELEFMGCLPSHVEKCLVLEIFTWL